MAKTANKGFKRIINASVYSYHGIKSAYLNEEAFRQEVILLCILTPVAFYFSDTLFQAIILISSLLFVLVVELINSAIEAVVDRISDEQHELSGRAKDMGSAAVFVALIISAGIWFSVLVQWLN